MRRVVSLSFTDMMDSAQQRTQARDWPRAADTFAAAAHVAGMGGKIPEAWKAWKAAGACWRRADDVAQAERCLRRALELTEPGGEAHLHTVPQLAGVMLDLGLAEAAEELLEGAAADAPGPVTSAIFLDTRIGALLALGRKEAGRVQLASLRGRARADLDARRAVDVRVAQLQVLDGELVRARKAWRRMLNASPMGSSPLTASILGGLAGVSSLLGEERESLELYQDCEALWRRAGRESQAYSALAGRVRMMVALGITPLPGLMDAGIAFAEERGMRPLLAGLLLSRGLARCETDPLGADEDLQRVMELGMECGSPVLVGRAAHERARRLPMSEAEADAMLETAAMAVVSHVPLAGRVALARARHLARTQPRQARALAAACLPRLERMGMRREVLAARALIRQLGGKTP